MPGLSNSSAARRGDLRVGDRERAEAAERLSAHAAAGRLDVEELEARLDRAQAAVLARDLHALEADLPAPAAPAPRPARRRPAPAIPPLVAALVVVAVLATVAVGHPVIPPLIAAFALWRFGGGFRPLARPSLP
jgi:uncharacterized protein DUF1707